MFHYAAKFILRHRCSVLGVLIVFTLFMGYKALDVRLSYKPAPLLPKDDSTLLKNKYFEKIFSRSENIMVIGVTDSMFFDKGNLSAWSTLEDTLRTVKGVVHVFSLSDAVNLVKNNETRKFDFKKILSDTIPSNQEKLDSIASIYGHLPFYNGLIYNADTHTYLMLIGLDRVMLTQKIRVKLVKNIKHLCEDYEVKTGNQLHYSGLPYIRVTVGEMIKTEMFLFVALAILVTSIILLLLFRSFKIVLISMTVVGIAVVWSLGTLSLFGYDLTLLTAVVPPLLIIIGVPNCIYLINKFHYEYNHHGNKIKALYRIVIRIGSATFLTNLTTAAGFATFIVTKTQILREFGVVASINVIGIFLISITLIPILFSFLSAPDSRHLHHLSRSSFKAAITKIVLTSLYNRKWVFISTGIIVFVGLIGVSLIKANGYMVDDIPQNHIVLKDLKYFEKHFSGVMPLEVVYNTGKANGYMDVSSISKINSLQDRLKKFDVLSKPLSIAEFAKFARQAYYNGNEKQYKIPGPFERGFILLYMPRSIGGSDLIAKLVDSTGQYVRIVYNVADIGSRKMNRLIDSIRSDVDSVFYQQAKDVSISGGSVVVTKGIDYLVHSLLTSLILAIITISLTIAWLFRKPRMVIFAVSINMIPLILTAATMGFLSINLKPSTVIVFSIAFGIAVDNSIHFLAKYRQELLRTAGNVKESVVYAIRETGISMIYTSLVLLFGFGVFTASRFGGTQALGFLVSLTLLFAVLANLFVLPSVILGWDRRVKIRVKRDEPSMELATGFEEDEEIEKMH